MLGLPISDAVTWANVGYLVSLLLTFVLSVTLWRATVMAQLENDAQLERYKADAAVKIQEAQTQAKQADERAAEAGARAQQAEARAAEANTEIEREKRLRAQFEAQFAWRLISKEAGDRLVEALKGQPGTVVLRYVQGDMEATLLAIQLVKIFEDGGWQVFPEGATYTGAVFFGLRVPDGGGRRAGFIRQTFIDVGLAPRDAEPPPVVMSFTGDQPQQAPDATVTVGPRPLPGNPLNLP